MRALYLCPLLYAQNRDSVPLHTGECRTHDSFHKQVVCLLCSEKLYLLCTHEGGRVMSFQVLEYFLSFFWNFRLKSCSHLSDDSAHLRQALSRYLFGTFSNLPCDSSKCLHPSF